MLEDSARGLYSQVMTETLASAIASVVGALDAIEDPTERFQVTKEAEDVLKSEMRGVRQRIALQLKNEHGITWREVGDIMGGVSPQRAEQISKRSR